MITGNIRNQIDALWNAFWSGGIANPMEVIEQITYLLFIKRLDDLHTSREKKASLLKQPIDKPVFSPKQQTFRWSLTIRWAQQFSRRMATPAWSSCMLSGLR